MTSRSKATSAKAQLGNDRRILVQAIVSAIAIAEKADETLVAARLQHALDSMDQTED